MEQFYIDCDSGNDANAGTSPRTAWRTLARANQVTFGPGDSLLLRRGTMCHGVLSPQGSGTASNPIVVSAYGKGARPAIVADGARAAVYLYNVQGWEIRHLDISNPGARDGTTRTGIYVLLENFGIGRHYVVDDVKVHDVVGCDCTGPESDPSGGVVFKAAGATAPTGFDGIRVSRSTVSGVDGYGIATSSLWDRRPQNPLGTGTFVPISRVHIFGNKLSDLGGDGIVVQNGVNSVIEWNRVNGFGLRATAFHAGLWAFNSDHPVMQFNEVSNGSSSPPAPAYDVDAGNSNVVYQYNFSHDNGGGFMFICADRGVLTDGATIRYNISQNDKNSQVGTITTPLIGDCPGNTATNVDFYNNVVYSEVAPLFIQTFGQSVITFRNNIFFGRPDGSTFNDPVGIYDHNLYHNISTVPPGDKNAVIGDPLFTNPGAATRIGSLFGYLLKCGSPALGAGIAIPDNGGRDLYGFPIPNNEPPNIGVYEGPCVPADIDD